jgi:hypothetical protein
MLCGLPEPWDCGRVLTLGPRVHANPVSTRAGYLHSASDNNPNALISQL